MLSIKKIDKQNKINNDEINLYADFLNLHLEQYGDKKQDILKAIDYALEKDNKPGGFLLVATNQQDKIVGITVVLNTLMEGFIPEHILVYIATDSKERGQGIGSQLIQRIKQEAKGSIALHVDADNPAQNLYERQGFEKKYIEMRLTK
ncbi:MULTISPECIES: GNAT family N-acetyltransferase [Myroides]|uniref:GNAT family N-acetyltransferase n=1 Tax=Myroides albus TaxID=2562892 RepID=A0A6I3LNN7_9FLAO|nr:MULTISPECIES: GNAT family N-acetyltransferase [Myroides]MTG97605.1 GNAT family N-acetyltransferase [Myroides albus]MVX35911.1 GNAT family N-acetyltransferase [Myroides sp. LoEW2-1]UVD79235.1 GNAT family N-acetyltransferase [Myroides albus]